jgi:hypothetical protein
MRRLITSEDFKMSQSLWERNCWVLYTQTTENSNTEVTKNVLPFLEEKNGERIQQSK